MAGALLSSCAGPLPCLAAVHGGEGWLAPRWVLRGQVEGVPLGQLCCQTPPVHSSGADGAAVGQEEWAALIAEVLVPSLPTC